MAMMNRTVKHKIKYTITDGKGVLRPWFSVS